MPDELHVIFGTGPVGCWTARALRSQGRAVRAVNRSGVRPGLMPADVEMAKADVADPGRAAAAASGASVVYQALNPPYHRWHEFFPGLQAAALAAAKTANARYVSIENLYMYDGSKPITDASPFAPVSRKGALRQKMAEEVMAAHAARRGPHDGPSLQRLLRTWGARFGTWVRGCSAIWSLGRQAQVSGSTTMPHSFAYIEDVGLAAAALGTHDNALGQAWIAPHAAARTQGQMIEEAGRVLGVEPGVRAVSPLMMRVVGLFNPAARASVEMMYQFTAPFVVDSSRIEGAFGLSATPIPVAVERTIAWYRDHLANG